MLFLIVGLQRSGTTFLHKSLFSHPDIGVMTDELHPLFFLKNPVNMYSFGNCTDEEVNSGHMKVLDALTSSNMYKVGGAKVCTTTNFRIAERIVNGIKNNLMGVKIIHVERSSLLNQYISLQTAKRTKRFHSWDKQHNECSQYKIRKSKFARYVYNCININHLCDSLKNDFDYIKINYEVLSSQYAKTISSLYDFFGISHKEPVQRSKKVIKDPSSLVSNFDEMKFFESEIRSKNMGDCFLSDTLNILGERKFILKTLIRKFSI